MQIHTFRQPPASFDPLTATTRELRVHGFPPRPNAGPHRERYESVLRQLKGKLNYVVPTMRMNADRSHGPRRYPTGLAEGAQATETSTNWSGAVVFAPSGKSFSWLQGDWVVPDVGAPTEGKWYYAASWIGIDGDGSGDVCQAGIECEVYRSGSSVTRSIYPWWEWFPLPEVQITNFPVASGDMVTMVLCANPGAGSTAATVFMTNRTTGVSTSVGFSAPTGTSLNGNSAEWVVEAPTVGGSQSSLADYGEVFFSVCSAFVGKLGSTGTTINGGTGDSINMVDSANNTVSTCSLITPTIVQCQYVGALP
jgi:hypothetical protein